MEIVTQRLLLRPILQSDDHDIYTYSKGANVGPNAGWKPHESIEETRKIMKAVFLDKKGFNTAESPILRDFSAL